jgi:SAM-dependent methyltransferase
VFRVFRSFSEQITLSEGRTPLAKAVPYQLPICGVDLSDTMVATARSLLCQAGVTAQVHQQDIRGLPYADNTFDLTMSAHMLEHLPDPGVGLREMIRVLRPGAPVLLAVTRFGPLGALLHLRWGNRSFTSEALSACLAETGLKDIRFYPFTTGWSRWTSFACLGFRD